MLVAIEGIDGSGKSHQAALLAAALEENGRWAQVIGLEEHRPIRQLYRRLISEPDGFPSPRTSVFLALADVAFVLDELVRALEDEGCVSICHRYMYSAITDALALGMPAKPLLALGGLFRVPDLVVFIATSPSVALARKGSVSLAEAGGPDFEALYPDRNRAFVEFQSRIQSSYRSILRPPLIPMNRCVVVDGDGASEAIHKSILGAVQDAFLGSCAGHCPGRL